MGGKHKQAERIKNNARPSSSGRSAELLASTSAISQFSTVKEIRFIPPTLSLLKTEEFDVSVSPDFQIVFKKMNKRDSTTKLKALQEFSELIINADIETIKTILAFWSTLYNILATDTDHRIREAVHNAHLQIILKDKKLIAPYLKQLIGPWFTSQYDTYAPAATQALKSFSAAFPANKVQDCVIYGQKEILSYISDNLNSKVEQKSGNNEEAEAKFERVIVSSLLGYCLYLNTLSQEQISKNDELNKKITSDPTFFKLATHKSCLIRGAWFQVVATLYHKAKFLLQDQHSAIVPLVFGNLDESEPGVVRSVWEAVLLIMDGSNEWWQYINVEKMYVTKLNKVLREGGKGNATVIYPNLLSLLHHLPPNVKLDLFYENFFSNMQTGLKRKTVVASKSEFTAIVTAFIECLQYVVLKNKDNLNLCHNLIKKYLLPTIEWSLHEKQISYRVVFNQVSLLVQYWNRNDDLIRYSAFFWEHLGLIFNEINSDLVENGDYFERQITFLQHLKNVSKPKEMYKVKFSNESNETNLKPTQNQSTDKINNSYNDDLLNLVYTVLKSYIGFVGVNENDSVLQHICILVQLFENKTFLTTLTKHLNSNNSEPGELIDIYKDYLYKWLKMDGLCIESVVDLCFTLYKYLNENEKRYMLNSFLEFCDNDCFCWFIKNSLSYPHNQDVLIQNWIQNEKVSKFLLKTTERNLQSDCPAELKVLFKLAFTENVTGDLLIGQETIKQIITKLREALSNPNDFLLTIDCCAHLASFISQIIYTENLLLKCGDDLLLSLFSFSITDHSDLETLTEDTLWEVSTSWQDALVILSNNLGKTDLLALANKFTEENKKNFLTNYSDESNMKRLSEAIVNFFRSILNSQPILLTDIYELFFNSEFSHKWKEQLNESCLIAEYLTGNMCSPTENFVKGLTINKEDVLKYFVWKNLALSAVASTCQEVGDVDEDEAEELNVTPIIYSLNDYIELLIEFLYDIALADSFTKHYKTTEHFQKIMQINVNIKEKLTFILDQLLEYDKLKSALALKLQTNVWLWSKTTEILNRLKEPIGCKEIYEYYSKQASPLAKLHLIQTFNKDLDFDTVHMNRIVCDNAIILRNLVHRDEIDVQIAEVFDSVKKLRNADIPRFLHENNDLSWEQREEIIEIIRLFTNLVSHKFDALNRQHWDFGVISLSSWTSNCFKLRSRFENIQFQAFIIAVCDYYVALNDKMNKFKMENIKHNFVDEWEDLFLPNIQLDLVQLWFYLADHFDSKSDIPLIYQTFIQSFGNIIKQFTYKLVLSKDNNLPSSSKILKRCFSLLKNSNTVLQLWGYSMLTVLIPGLIEIDLEIVNSTNSKGYVFEQFITELEQIQTIVNDILVGFKLGEDSCLVKPFTDSYTYTFAYSLLWYILLNFCHQASPELRYQYADSLKNNNSFKALLNNLFKLMPVEIIQNSDGKGKAFLKLYQEEPSLGFNDPPQSELLEHFVCWVYAYALTQLPVLVRQWWSETDTKISQIVERVTSHYVSPQLCQQELLEVAQHEKRFKNMTIKTVQSVREVVAVYTVDEAQMELVITLPHNYPLGGPDVKCNRQIGGAQHKQWLMQLKKCLLHQNGRIWDGLSLWNANLDKKFDGVEECYICFSVLHPGTYQLPKLSCQTCKKKFHSACLFKWFSTSNKSSCPICRNLF